MEKIVLPAKLENLESMLEFINKGATDLGFDNKKINQIRLASEEALVNIINYAYPGKEGDIEITCASKEGKELELKIVDWGIPFNPLTMPEPDITIPLEKRETGGLGVYMIRKIMDEVDYERRQDRNILTLVKYWGIKMENLPESENIETPKQEASYKWPLSYINWLLSHSFMKEEKFKKGDVLFKIGDKADKMFYIKKGAIKLIEINKIIREDEVIGEMGIFSPFRQRMASAVCEEDLEVYTMGKDEVIKLFSQDSSLALNLIELSFKRFIENIKAETAAREHIESELRIAREIQTCMLPRTFPPFPDRKEFEIFATMDPAKEVGGDFYDFFLIDKNRLCCLIGDVSGKGVPAALFMAITKTLLKTEALRGLSPNEVLSHVNNILCPDNETCMFVTVFCVVLNIETGVIQFSNGGHNPPLVCSGSGGFEFIEVPRGFVLGPMENIRFERRMLPLKSNDIIFLYTDGVTEAMNPQEKLFSEERLKACLCKLKEKDITNIVNGVRKEIQIFSEGTLQSDDITMLALKYRGKGV